MRRVLLFGVCVLAAGLLIVAGCGDDDDEPATRPQDWKTIARARAAALFAEERFPEARQALERLTSEGRAAGEDLVRAAVADMWIGAPDSYRKAMDLLQRALKVTPEDPAVHYNLAKLYERGQTEKALTHMQRAHELAPDDYPTTLALAGLLEQADRRDEAVALYEKLHAIGVENAGSWHLITLYQLGQVRIRQGKREEGRTLLAERADLTHKGVTVPSADESARGNLGTLRPPPAGGGSIWKPSEGVLSPRRSAAVLTDYEHVRPITLVDDWTHADTGCVVHPPDLVGWGTKGLAVAKTEDGIDYETIAVHTGGVGALAALDLDNDRDVDFVVSHQGGVHVFVAQADGKTWARDPIELPKLPTPPEDIEPVDFDHDGDVDLLLVGDWGARLWRNDGLAVKGGKWTDASKEASLPSDIALSWCVVEDFDTDQDVDLLLGASAAPVLMDNLRSGRFRKVVLDLDVVSEPLVADCDADGRPDLLARTSRGPKIWRGTPTGTFVPLDRPLGDLRLEGSLLDWDLDGVVDYIGRSGDGLLAIGHASPAPLTLLEPNKAAGDLDGNRFPELLVKEKPERRLDSVSLEHRGCLLALRGIKSNARGVGAIVEVRAGPIYRRIFWRGEPELIGLGKERYADVIRITWPNGVVQHQLDIEAGAALLVEQSEGLVGSCPFLYTWNGDTYEYISDVLGITPMGLPMAPGMLVPPDHDEYVRVRGEQLQPRTVKGSKVYDMQFTEELREVTYLDRAKLLVVDHPEDTEMFPTERFSFPPFPKHHVNVVKPVAPKRVTGSDGKDWTESLAKIDSAYASPFEPMHGQFLGLANPHWLELEFDPTLVGSAKRLRLICTGWFFWTDASVNMASARTPGVEFVPPILQVPVVGNGGGWKNAGPPVGFPAGKTKTMVLDVSELLRPDDPRIRIFSTLRLYWDSIRLAVGDDHASATATLEPVSAHLWERGFSKPIPTGGEHALDWFEWDATDAPRWNQHPGMYTKHGEVLPLVQAVDDQFVIMGSGDALRLRFDASKAPPLQPGWRRDFLVFLDGWAKDRDHNTHEALFVEPLPFHGMKGYPYPPDQSYPDTPATRAYRDTWNTRPARTWLPSLKPRR